MRPGDVPRPRRDDRTDGAKFLREQARLEMDLAESEFVRSHTAFVETIGQCVASFAALATAWREGDCLNPTFSDEDQDLLVSLGMTRG